MTESQIEGVGRSLTREHWERKYNPENLHGKAIPRPPFLCQSPTPSRMPCFLLSQPPGSAGKYQASCPAQGCCRLVTVLLWVTGFRYTPIPSPLPAPGFCLAGDDGKGGLWLAGRSLSWCEGQCCTDLAEWQPAPRAPHGISSWLWWWRFHRPSAGPAPCPASRTGGKASVCVRGR